MTLCLTTFNYRYIIAGLRIVTWHRNSLHHFLLVPSENGEVSSHFFLQLQQSACVVEPGRVEGVWNFLNGTVTITCIRIQHGSFSLQKTNNVFGCASLRLLQL